jgi:hypothetical protein
VDLISNIERTVQAGSVVEASLHARAIQRHAAWARDHASFGELEEATAELCDIHALAAELHALSDRDRPATGRSPWMM